MPESSTMDKPTTAGPTQADADKWLEMFSIFIHDIESPLASVKYLLQLLEQGNFDQDKELHQRMVVSSRVALERAESIIYDIMAVARSGKAGLPVRCEVVDAAQAVRDALVMASASAQERELKLVVANDFPSEPVEADPRLLARVLDNLLFNAMRHTPSGKKIAVYSEQGNESLFIHVKDSGSGLGDVDPGLLFEKYGQLQMRSEGKHRGVGLGLYFCKLAVTGMGGTILAADHPDGGAVFSIRLRKAKEQGNEY